MAKLTKEEVDKIKDLLENSYLSQVNIAKEIDVIPHTVSNINVGKTYREEDRDYPIRKEPRKMSDIALNRPSESKLRAMKVQDALIYTDRTMKDIAKEYGISISGVSRINSGQRSRDEELNYPLRITGEMRGRRIRMDAAEGMSEQDIIEKYDITSKALRDYLRTK